MPKKKAGVKKQSGLERHNYFEFPEEMKKVRKVMKEKDFKTISQFLRAAREYYINTFV